jgi:hypothetical protein
VLPISRRLIAELVVAVVLLVAFVWYRQHLIDEGEARVKAADARVAAARKEANALREAQLQTVVAQEKTDYVEKITAPVDHPVAVRLCHDDSGSRRAVSAAAASGPAADAAPAVRAEPPRDSAAGPGPDIGNDLIRNDRQADAQVVALQDYIRNVCLATH